jgi:hypothetical protein
MSKLDQPLRVKHGLAAVAAALALGVAGTAIPLATAGGGGGGLHYVRDGRSVNANSQARERADCPPGTKVVGGGAESSAGFSNANGMMLNTSRPFDDRDGNPYADDGWVARVDVFQNAGGQRFQVYAICKG